MTRYPLAASPRHWPAEARERLTDFVADKSAFLIICAGVPEAEAQARAASEGERLIRAQWIRTLNLR